MKSESLRRVKNLHRTRIRNRANVTFKKLAKLTDTASSRALCVCVRGHDCFTALSAKICELRGGDSFGISRPDSSGFDLMIPQHVPDFCVASFKRVLNALKNFICTSHVKTSQK